MEERIIDKLMLKRIKSGSIEFKVVDLLFIGCLFFFAFMIRWKLMPIESADYWGFLEDWMGQIREAGGFPSLGKQISNYTSPYMYIMCLLSYVTDNDLYGLKMVSVLFDYLASMAVFLIVYRLTYSKGRAIMAMAGLLLSPTVILDGAYWCQCDIIYTTFILYALYCFLKGNSEGCLILIGVSFAFKLQTIFIVPFLLIMWLKKKTIYLRHFLWIPVIYIISALPAWRFGRDFKELMLIYFEQSETYPWGTLEYPNIYALLGEAMPDLRHAGEVGGAGTFMTIMLLGCTAYYLYTKKVRLTGELMVTLALFTVAITVYSLPHMHDRYGFLIDLLAIIYGTMNVKKLPVTCAFMLVSVLTFMPYLIAVHIVPLQYVAIALFGLIVYVGHDLHAQIKKQEMAPP
ncbi:hypothetical protein [Parablautia muri]|uniref:Glycosyltransferase RgtA/B/C/D-like domain-containing protein n=1 Tax=Parablautia muri TaxID=2320879 RepID=A0A9X5BI98_9FIRM|nr:hypothetical protein [Parablautia muri]NBJ93397.1 hypothetical protein [Parablautia muri]